MNFGIENGVIREPVQVMMHLPENWTKILFLRTYGLGLADGGTYWDIPTETIPLEFRSIGCRFILKAKTDKISAHDLHGREHLYSEIEIEELPEAAKLLWPKLAL